jgi:osmotically-inducible protein OsmY
MQQLSCIPSSTAGDVIMVAVDPIPQSGTAREGARTSLADLAESRLRRHPHLALKNVSCDLGHGVLVLRGQVPTYYLKQMAYAAVADLAGVLKIVNQVDVGEKCARGH